MQENDDIKRVVFTLELLDQLKNVNYEIVQSIGNVQKCSSDFYKKLLFEKKDEIHSDIGKYNSNIEKVKKLNLEATNIINEWFELIKSPNQIKKITFPIIFLINKKKLSRQIKHINTTISDIFIENRIIIERLANWEHQLEISAIKLINDETDFKNYEELMAKKEAVLSSLKYLLPTVPNACPAELDLLNVDKFIDKINPKIRLVSPIS